MPIPPYGSAPAPVKKLVAGSNITLSPATGLGSVTISASVSGGSSPLTTKGDLYGYDTTNDRLPAGSVQGVPLQVASVSALGLGYGLTTYNLNDQGLVNTSQVLIGEYSSTSGGIVGLEYGLNGTFSAVGVGAYYGLSITDQITFATNNIVNNSAMFNISSIWTINKTNASGALYAARIAPTFAGSVANNAYYGLYVAPTYAATGGTAGNVVAGQFIPNFGNNASVTATTNVVLSLGMNGSGATSTVGLDLGYAHGFDIISGGTGWGIQQNISPNWLGGCTAIGGGATSSGNFSVGGTGATLPTWALHIIGGNSVTSGVGLNSSASIATTPASAAGFVMQAYKGTAGNNYLMYVYNDAGTTKYIYTKLTGATATAAFTVATALPT